MRFFTLSFVSIINLSVAAAFGFIFLSSRPTLGQNVNYDESKTPQYVLPNPLISEDGTKIETPEDWRNIRRPEILKQFQTEMFGKYPEADLSKVKFEEIFAYDQFLGGKATIKVERVYFNAPESKPKMDLMVVVPNDRKGAVPAFLMPNFQGNHTTNDDVNIPVSVADETIHNKDKSPGISSKSISSNLEISSDIFLMLKSA